MSGQSAQIRAQVLVTLLAHDHDTGGVAEVYATVGCSYPTMAMSGSDWSCRDCSVQHDRDRFVTRSAYDFPVQRMVSAKACGTSE